jgi:bifunctional UDP-N-acetylglucosamine pyrophosphorylase/glucosamine-1-phosphate N-acetyltransferase
MVDHLVQLYRPVVDRIILVLSPSALGSVREHCAAHDVEMEFCIQEAPTGMLDAIRTPAGRVAQIDPGDVWITWCDQVAVSPRTVEQLTEAAAGAPEAAMILPTVERREPYIHFVRTSDGTIVDVLHRREGDRMPDVGESDMGLFRLSTPAYLRSLAEYADLAPVSAVTGERNFLPFIPWLADRDSLVTIRVRDPMESVGINTPEELLRVEEHLAQRGEAKEAGKA